MTYPRASPGEEASVPKEFMIEDDLHRDEARAAEDTADVTASQISRSTMSLYDYLQNVDNSPIIDHTAGNFETEAEDERRLEGISLAILKDPSASLSNVRRILPIASPGKYSWASKHFPAGRYSSTCEEEQERTPSCKSPTRSVCHGAAHYHAGSAAIKSLEENVDRLSGLVEVLQDHCKCHQSHKEADKTTQIPEEETELEHTPLTLGNNEADDAETLQRELNGVGAPQEMNEVKAVTNVEPPQETNEPEALQDAEETEAPQAGFFGRSWNHIRATPGALFGTVRHYLNGATTGATEPEILSEVQNVGKGKSSEKNKAKKRARNVERKARREKEAREA